MFSEEEMRKWKEDYPRRHALFLELDAQRTTWKTDTDYKVGDIVSVMDEKYECIVEHKSNIFGDEWFGKDNSRKTVPICWKKV